MLFGHKGLNIKNMKILIYGKDAHEIEKAAEKVGFEVINPSQIKSQFDMVNPEIVVSYGGDGTFMKSEREFPGVPKFALRKSKICKKCQDIGIEEAFKKVSVGEYRIIEEIKIESICKGKQIIGMNEIIVHNANPRSAIRYEIFINDKNIGKEIIGDGVVVSTPYGSTGYYKSITGGVFEVGIGLAFNNSTEQKDHMVIKEDAEIRIKIIRGPAVAYADNDETEITLDDGDIIEIKKSKDMARIIKVL